MSKKAHLGRSIFICAQNFGPVGRNPNCQQLYKSFQWITGSPRHIKSIISLLNVHFVVLGYRTTGRIVIGLTPQLTHTHTHGKSTANLQLFNSFTNTVLKSKVVFLNIS